MTEAKVAEALAEAPGEDAGLGVPCEQCGPKRRSYSVCRIQGHGRKIATNPENKDEPSTKAARNCCWTLNNYTDDDLKQIEAWDCKYVIYGMEKGEQGTPHLQGYVEWRRPKEWKSLKNLHARIHWEARKGKQEQAILYCKKGEQPSDEFKKLGALGANFGKNAKIYERGDMGQQGARSDLEEVAKAVLNKEPIQQIAAKFPVQYIKYHKGIDRLVETQMVPRSAAPYVEWRWGPAGRGKTSEPAERHKDSFYIKDGTSWWQNYTQQEAIIIDDFDGKWPFRDLLRLLDEQPYQGQTKGGYVHINSPYIYITCEYPPEHFWGPMANGAYGAEATTQNQLAQIVRRISKITFCEEDKRKARPRRVAPHPKVPKEQTESKKDS